MHCLPLPRLRLHIPNICDWVFPGVCHRIRLWKGSKPRYEHVRWGSQADCGRFRAKCEEKQLNHSNTWFLVQSSSFRKRIVTPSSLLFCFRAVSLNPINFLGCSMMDSSVEALLRFRLICLVEVGCAVAWRNGQGAVAWLHSTKKFYNRMILWNIYEWRRLGRA